MTPTITDITELNGGGYHADNLVLRVGGLKLCRPEVMTSVDSGHPGTANKVPAIVGRRCGEPVL